MSQEIKKALKEAAKDSDGIDSVFILGLGKNQKLSVLHGVDSRTTALMIVAELEMMKSKLIDKISFLDDLSESEED